VQCIGHAGASEIAPANSLESFALAAELGADHIEFDVRQWRGRLLLAHNAFDAQFGRCLRLSEALEELSGERYAGLGFVVDLKTGGSAAPVIEGLKHHGLFDRALVTSQCPPFLAAVRRIAPDARLGISIAGRFARRLQRWGDWRSEVLTALHAGHYHALMAHHRLIDRDLVDRVAAAGAELHAWTVGCPDAMRSLAGLGVDGVVTGNPRLMRQAITPLAAPTPAPAPVALAA
jgi:glycerophosphoryl diester phosphodiesterase